METDLAGDLFESWSFARGEKALLNTEMLAFLERPTLKHARFLLRSLDIPLPLKTVVNAEKHRRRTADTRLDIGGGGDRDEAVRELFLIDTLHDLAYMPDVVSTYKIIVGSVDFPKELKALYLARSPLFTAKAGEYLCAKYGVVLTSAMNTDERRLVDQIIYTRPYSRSQLEIVMDNLVAGLQMGSAWSSASIGLAGCAYVLVLCHHMKYLGQIQIDQHIVLYDGWFQNFDGAHIQRFAMLFRKSLKRVCRSRNVQLQLRPEKDGFVPANFNKHLSCDAELKVFKNSAGLESPYMTMSGKKFLIEVPGVAVDPDLEAICEQVRFPHNKSQFVGYVESMKKKSRDLWYLNFLRDCLRAEMAMQKNAIYLTHDRLAYLYYRLIGGASGFLLSINSSDNPASGDGIGVDSIVYKVTV